MYSGLALPGGGELCLFSINFYRLREFVFLDQLLRCTKIKYFFTSFILNKPRTVLINLLFLLDYLFQDPKVSVKSKKLLEWCSLHILEMTDVFFQK